MSHDGNESQTSYEEQPQPPVKRRRHGKSLGILTRKFVSLLQTSPNGILDLKIVSIFHKY